MISQTKFTPTQTEDLLIATDVMGKDFFTYCVGCQKVCTRLQQLAETDPLVQLAETFLIEAMAYRRASQLFPDDRRSFEWSQTGGTAYTQVLGNVANVLSDLIASDPVLQQVTDITTIQVFVFQVYAYFTTRLHAEIVKRICEITWRSRAEVVETISDVRDLMSQKQAAGINF